MEASIARLERGLPRVKPDRRKEARYSAWHEITLVSSQDERCDALVADVSMHGCSVRAEATWLKTGSIVSIGLGESELLQAIIRWVRNDAAGMEFLRPIPSDQIEWQDLIDLQF